MRPTICSLFEPHHKQNLYTNPKRTAKSHLLRPKHNRYHRSASCSKKFCFSKNLSSFMPTTKMPHTHQPDFAPYHTISARFSPRQEGGRFFPKKLSPNIRIDPRRFS